MAQDEGRFGRMSRPRRCWAPAQVRPHAPSQVVRESTYVFAAVAPEQGLMTSLVLPSADTAMMNLFLAHLSETNNTPGQAVADVASFGGWMADGLTPLPRGAALDLLRHAPATRRPAAEVQQRLFSLDHLGEPGG